MICPECNKKIGFRGLERTSEYANNKAWYQLAKYKQRCPHCKIALKSKNAFCSIGLLAIIVLFISNITLAFYGRESEFFNYVKVGYVIGLVCFAIYMFGFRAVREREN